MTLTVPYLILAMIFIAYKYSSLPEYDTQEFSNPVSKYVQSERIHQTIGERVKYCIDRTLPYVKERELKRQLDALRVNDATVPTLSDLLYSTSTKEEDDAELKSLGVNVEITPEMEAPIRQKCIDENTSPSYYWVKTVSLSPSIIFLLCFPLLVWIVVYLGVYIIRWIAQGFRAN